VRLRALEVESVTEMTLFSALLPARNRCADRAPVRSSRRSIGRAALALGCAAALAAAGCASKPAGGGPSPVSAKESRFPKPAPTKTWDQAAVTSLAQQLAQKVNQVYNAYYAMPGSGGQVGSGDAVDTNRLENTLIVLQQMTQGLAGQLAKGKGRVETTGQFEDIGEKARDAEVLFSFMYQEDPIVQTAREARAVWKQLQPYYGVPEPYYGVNQPLAR
jgi:hypothetical protein